jgi:ketosteroid isomerase-like protein
MGSDPLCPFRGEILISIQVRCVRRSSKIILTAAIILLVSVVAMTLLYRDVSAPVMNPSEAEKLLKRGVSALERGDVDAVMELFATDASIFKKRPDQLRRALARSLNEIDKSRFVVTWKDLSVIQRGQGAVIQATISLGEQSNEMNSIYYNDVRIRVTLEKVRSSEWFGLYSLEQWKITDLTSDVEIEISEN